MYIHKLQTRIAALAAAFALFASLVLPAPSRAILFQRLLTIVYVAQEIEIKKASAAASE